MTGIEVPADVLAKTAALGAAGAAWVESLPRLIAEVEQDWGIAVGKPLSGGSGGYVALATAADGTEAVLKLAIPDGLDGHVGFAHQRSTLLEGQGAGFVRVLASDVPRRAMLLERLGRPLHRLGLSADEQIDVTADTLARCWRTPSPDAVLRTGAEQAAFLESFVGDLWEGLGRPCPAGVVERARHHARVRHAAYDPETAVLVHGDAHGANVLEDPAAPPGTAFKLIDPDGLRSEPAHDLGIVLREWNDELRAADASARLGAWCRRLEARTGADARATWEWAFLERVSTGLFLLRLGHEEEGRAFLDVAATLDETAAGLG